MKIHDDVNEMETQFEDRLVKEEIEKILEDNEDMKITFGEFCVAVNKLGLPVETRDTVRVFEKEAVIRAIDMVLSFR